MLGVNIGANLPEGVQRRFPAPLRRDRPRPAFSRAQKPIRTVPRRESAVLPWRSSAPISPPIS
jgi:hypothetical protein